MNTTALRKMLEESTTERFCLPHNYLIDLLDAINAGEDVVGLLKFTNPRPSKEMSCRIKVFVKALQKLEGREV